MSSSCSQLPLCAFKAISFIYLLPRHSVCSLSPSRSQRMSWSPPCGFDHCHLHSVDSFSLLSVSSLAAFGSANVNINLAHLQAASPTDRPFNVGALSPERRIPWHCLTGLRFICPSSWHCLSRARKAHYMRLTRVLFRWCHLNQDKVLA